jgi:hypothetical protein
MFNNNDLSFFTDPFAFPSLRSVFNRPQSGLHSLTAFPTSQLYSVPQRPGLDSIWYTFEDFPHHQRTNRNSNQGELSASHSHNHPEHAHNSSHENNEI